MGSSDAILVNSGSSANLIALTALTSPTLGERQLQPGDEVITVAAGFPTTVAPIMVVSRFLCKWNFTGATGLRNGWLTG